MREHRTGEPVARREDRHGHRWPVALLGALAIVAAVEIGLRQVDPQSLIVSRGDADQARAVRDEIDLPGAPDVALVGSSMMYQGVSVPEFEHDLSQAAGRPVNVANYAIRGGRMDLFAATIRQIVEQPERPRLILVGTSMRDLREFDLELDRLSLFWSIGDFVAIARERGLPMNRYLPIVIRNEIEPHLLTLRYRNAITRALQSPFVPVEIEPLPARGEKADALIGSRGQRMLADEMDAFRKRTNRRRMMQSYRLELPPIPPKVMSDQVEEIIRVCAAHHVDVIFVELPLSEPMSGLIRTATKTSKKFEPTWRLVMAEKTQPASVPFIPFADLGLSLSDRDFADGQHLNEPGALKLGAALVPLIIERLNRSEDRSHTRY